MGREKSGVSRKQFMLLDGAPILIHTIRKFFRCPSVKEIVIALRAEDIEWARGLVHQEHPSKPVRFVEGGDSRQASVENALATIAPEDGLLVAVHDAVALGAELHEHQPQDDVRVMLDPAGHPFCLYVDTGE